MVCATFVLLVAALSKHVAPLSVGVETPLGQAFVDTYWGPTFANISNTPTTMIPIQQDDDIYGLLSQLDLVIGSATLMNCVRLMAPYFALSSLVQFERNTSSSYLVGGIIFVTKRKRHLLAGRHPGQERGLPPDHLSESQHKPKRPR